MPEADAPIEARPEKALIESISGQQTDNKNIGFAAFGSGGIGTFIVAYAQSLPEGHHWKSFLIITAPAFTILLSSIWIFIEREFRKNAKEKKYLKLESKLLEIINDQQAPVEMRKQCKELLIKLRDIYFVSEIKIIGK